MTYSRDAFWELQASLRPGKAFVDSVVAAAKTIGAEKVDVFANVDGYLVDVKVGDAAVLCHTALTLHRRDNTPLGLTMLRHRYFFLDHNVSLPDLSSIFEVVRGRFDRFNQYALTSAR